MTILFDIDSLTVRYQTPDGEVAAVNAFSLQLAAGECVGIVGESGAGKSQALLASMGLLPANARVTGSVRLGDTSLLDLRGAELDAVRGRRIAMIFQDPMTSLTPHLQVGEQIAESLRHHRGLSRAEARARALDLLQRVQVTDAARRLHQYPHELSGGMRQRVMIAIALACDPEVLIADEPTTALDVTVQAQILGLLAELKKTQRMALVIVTHDLGVVAGVADRVVVMYGGRVVESGPVGDMLRHPRHPYTQALLRSMPRLDDALDAPLRAIAGQPPSPLDLPTGCAFHPRCERADARCRREAPQWQTRRTAVACHYADELE